MRIVFALSLPVTRKVYVPVPLRVPVPVSVPMPFAITRELIVVALKVRFAALKFMVNCLSPTGIEPWYL